MTASRAISFVRRIGLASSIALGVLLLSTAGCEDLDREIISCGDWVGVLTKHYEGEVLVGCRGDYTPGCYFEDGTPVSDSTVENITWDFGVDDDLILNGVGYSELYGTNSRVEFEAAVIGENCGVGAIFFVVEGGDDLVACDFIEIDDQLWETAGEIHD